MDRGGAPAGRFQQRRDPPRSRRTPNSPSSSRPPPRAGDPVGPGQRGRGGALPSPPQTAPPPAPPPRRGGGHAPEPRNGSRYGTHNSEARVSGVEQVSFFDAGDTYRTA